MSAPLAETPNRLQDLGRVIAHKSKSIWNPDFFKNESLILASLALVVSRIVVANVSAIKAQGTPEGPYRYRESIRTDMREVGGFTLGFLVLRFLQSGVKKATGKLLGIAKAEHNPNDYSLFRNLKNALSGKPIDPYKPDLTHLSEIKLVNGELNGFSKWLTHEAPLFKHVAGKYFQGSAEKAVKQIYRVAPLVISAIPTVFLAGTLLERMTRDHSEQVVDAVSKRLNPKSTSKGIKPLAQAVPPQPAPSLPMPAPQFGARSGIPQSYRYTASPFGVQRI